jgi:putative hydroxymethylpyrimidine transport system substrate-binding protein
MRSRQRRAAVTFGVAGLALTLLAACGSSSGGGSSSSATTSGASSSSSSPVAMRNITVLLDWFPNPDHVALYMAAAKGYFKDAGLNVKLQAPSDPSDPPKLVSTGKVELGISYEPEQFLSQQAGLNVTAVGALIPTALNSVLATKNSPVKQLCDLGGKKVGDAGLSTDAAFLQTIFAHCNINASTVQVINLKTSLITAMVSGSVDATIGGYRNIEAVQLQMMGQSPLVVPVSEAGVPNYDELVIIANSTKLKSDPAYQQIVKDFLGAVKKGAQAAIADPAGALAAMTPVAKGYDKAQLAKMVQVTIPLQTGAQGILGMSDSEWTAFGDWMLKNKLIKAAIPSSSVMTTSFLPTS